MDRVAHAGVDLLAYLRRHTLAVLATHAADGAPQAALVGVAITDDFTVVFDTVSDSRKHANLLNDARAALVFSGPGERTVQLEGAASLVSATAPCDAIWREAYFAAWPSCRDHLAWPKIAYWRITPRWLRYSDYDASPPAIFEKRWDANDTAVHR